MDLLIVDLLDAEVRQWLEGRHTVRYAPELAQDPKAFRQALAGVRALILPSSVAFGSKSLPLAPKLRAVGRVHSGAENIDLEACLRAGVEVVRSGTATAQAEAEFMIGALLSMLRRVPVETSDGMRVGRELGACTVGLLGMPPAARAMGTMLSGFGCRVIGYEPSLHASDGVWDRWKVVPVGLRDLFEMSDAVAVQLNYFTRYQGLIGDRLLPYAKRDQVIVSVSHSGVFDEAALAEALSSGRVSAAWLDSLEPGALDDGRPLHGIGSLQITPRLASTTRESRLRSAWSVARRIDELLMALPAVPAEFRPTSPGEPLDLATEPESP